MEDNAYLLVQLNKSTDIEIVALNDADLAILARKTFLLISTVGPYGFYGEHVYSPLYSPILSLLYYHN